jgi:hypothetical protein
MDVMLKSELPMGKCAQNAKEPQIDMVISTLIKTVRENLVLINELDYRLCASSPENIKDVEAPSTNSISGAIAAIAQELSNGNNMLARLNDRLSDEIGNLKVIG